MESSSGREGMPPSRLGLPPRPPLASQRVATTQHPYAPPNLQPGVPGEIQEIVEAAPIVNAPAPILNPCAHGEGVGGALGHGVGGPSVGGLALGALRSFALAPHMEGARGAPSYGASRDVITGGGAPYGVPLFYGASRDVITGGGATRGVLGLWGSS